MKKQKEVMTPSNSCLTHTVFTLFVFLSINLLSLATLLLWLCCVFQALQVYNPSGGFFQIKPVVWKTINMFTPFSKKSPCTHPPALPVIEIGLKRRKEKHGKMSRQCVFLQACGEAGRGVWVRSDSGAYRAPVSLSSSFHFSSDFWHGRKVMMSDHRRRKT